MLPRIPFSDFSEHQFKRPHSVIKISWLRFCGFLVLFPSPTFICLYCLCIAQLNRVFVFIAALCRWEVQVAAAPVPFPGHQNLPKWIWQWAPVGTFSRQRCCPGLPLPWFLPPHGCWLPKALWHTFQHTCTSAFSGMACHQSIGI